MWARTFRTLLPAACVAAGGCFSITTESTDQPPAPVASIRVEVPDTIGMPGNLPIVSWGDISAQVYDAQGARTRCQHAVTYQSSNPSVAGVRITERGWGVDYWGVDAVHGGTTTISVTCDGVTGSKVLTVMEIVSITIAPSTATMSVGQDLQFGASVTAIPTAPNMGIIWSSSSDAFATVDPTGKVRAVFPGVVVIVAQTPWGGRGEATILVVR